MYASLNLLIATETETGLPFTLVTPFTRDWKRVMVMITITDLI